MRRIPPTKYLQKNVCFLVIFQQFLVFLAAVFFFQTHHLQYPNACKFQNVHRGPQNGQRGLERGLTLGYRALQTTFVK